jgi:Antitoxin Phd_YefM, type II toxin-antitoxin system
MKAVPHSEVKDDLSRFLRLAETEQIVITRHGGAHTCVLISSKTVVAATKSPRIHRLKRME